MERYINEYGKIAWKDVNEDDILCAELFHDAIVGAAPETMSANKAYTSHVQSFYGDMLRSIYKGFFTDDEFAELFNGRQWWMRADEVETRFKRRLEMLEQEEQQESPPCKECSCNVD